jgi:hypothetical protein
MFHLVPLQGRMVSRIGWHLYAWCCDDGELAYFLPHQYNLYAYSASCTV